MPCAASPVAGGSVAAMVGAMEDVDVVVVGAGVVGLAVARALALAGREVMLLDAAEGIGTETSSRNSEVIHAGIYYPAGSLMAKHCVAGKQALYAYCDERGVPYSRCTKLIVATNEEEAGKLASIQARAAANGVPDLTLLGRAAGAGAGARAGLHRRPAQPQHRHHRQPRLHAGAAGRCGECRRHLRLPRASAGRAADRCGGGNRYRRRRGDDAAGRDCW